MKNYNKRILLIMPFVLLFFSCFALFNNKEMVFATENREATMLKDIKKIDQVEDFLIDQFPKRETIIAHANGFIEDVEAKILSKLHFKVQDLKQRYLILEHGFYLPSTKEKVSQSYTKTTEFLEYLSTFDQELYYINAGGKQKYGEPYKHYGIRNSYPLYEQEFLQTVPSTIAIVNNNWDMNAFFQYFYKTDHHLNLQGTLEIYKEFVRVSGQEDFSSSVPVMPYEKAKFFGSDAKAVNKYDVCDEFYGLDFDKIKFSYVGNKEQILHKNLTEERVNTMNTNKENYYGIVFGGDYGKLVIHNPQNTNGKRLLLIGDSYSNSLNHLLAYNYEMVIDVDTRYYEKVYGEKANLEELVRSYEIDHILVYTGMTVADESSYSLDFADVPK